jgi:hypothetical protein
VAGANLPDVTGQLDFVPHRRRDLEYCKQNESIAQNLDAEITRENGRGYSVTMTRANADAAQAVDEFNGALEGVRTMLEQQQSWLADENKRLGEMRRM